MIESMVGFFMDDGIHAGRDIPRIIEDIRPDTAYTGPIGCSDKVPEFIVDLVRAEAQKSR